MPKTAMVVIDVQKGILRSGCRPRNREALDATVQRIAALIEEARRAGVPVVYVQHVGERGHRLEPGTEGFPIREELTPRAGDSIVHKKFCDAFFQTTLQDELAKRAATQIVIAGCMTQYCIDTSVRRAVSLGYDVMLVADGHMTADSAGLTFEQIIAHHNDLLKGFNAGVHAVRVVPAAQVRFE